MTNVAFREVDDPPGLEIQDLVNKRQFTLHTSAVPDLRPAGTEPFLFPVEEARQFATERILISEFTSVHVRDATGEQVVSMSQDGHEQLPADEYVVELDGQVKAYLLVDAPIGARSEDHNAELSFGSPTAVTVGARARLRRPPTTVTTTTDLDDARRALETFSSTLQTTSPERSFPTLRGHPPRLVLGEELRIPEGVEPPHTGITLVVPRELSSLFTVAPLSYYLGAALEFGDEFRLETDRGLAFTLDVDGVERVLKHVFLLDCLVRSHGLYKQKTVEYEAVAPELSLDLPALYDATPAERVEAYLSVPTTVTEPYVPRWPSVAYVDPTPGRLEALPFLVDDLALVRTSGVTHHRGDEARRLALSRFIGTTATTRGASSVFEGRDAFVDTPETDARHRIWVGNGIPINASKFVTSGYEQQVQREPTDRERLRVTVVCNDESMASEATAVESRYRTYADGQLGVIVHERVTTKELAALLRADSDFFHFIGHATENGLECHDGYLDVRSVDDVGFDQFLLNACQSYRQGVGLVECGAVGGVVTLSDVPNGAAVETGRRLSRLLDSGFTLRDALSVARQLSIVGGQYTLVGDSRTTLNRAVNSTASVIRVESMEDGYALRIETFLDEAWRMGSRTNSRLNGDDWRHFLSGGEVGPFDVSLDDVMEYLATVPAPVWIDGEFHWSTDVSREDLEG